MAAFFRRFSRVPHVPAELVWSLGAISLAAFLVQITGSGIDLLVLMLFGATIVTIDHALGDTMTSVVGPNVWGLFLAGLALASIWFLVAKNGTADQFFQAAERVGYHTAYYDTSPRKATSRPVVAAIDPAPEPAATTGRAGVDSAGPAVLQQSPSPLHAFRGPWNGPAVSSTLRLDMPEIGLTGEKLPIRVVLRAASEPVKGAEISVTVDDRPLGTVRTGQNGIATLTFTTGAPGQYQVRAHFEASAEFQSSKASAILHILPGRR